MSGGSSAYGCPRTPARLRAKFPLSQRFRSRSSVFTSFNSSQLPDPRLTSASTRLRSTRRKQACVAGVNATLSGVAFALGSCAVEYREDLEWNGTVALEATRSFVSLAQAACVVITWSLWLKLQETARVRFALDIQPISPLGKSFPHILACSLECLFHLIPIYSCLSTSSPDSELQQLPLLLLGYHLVQWAYWESPYSSGRNRYFAQVQGAECLLKLAAKMCLLRHGFLSLILLFFTAALAGGVVVFDLTRDEPFLSIESSIYALTHVKGNGAVMALLALCGWLLQSLCIFVLLRNVLLTNSEKSLCSEIVQRYYQELLNKKAAGQGKSLVQNLPFPEPNSLPHSSGPGCAELQEALEAERRITIKVREAKEDLRRMKRRTLQQIEDLLISNCQICKLCCYIAELTNPEKAFQPVFHRPILLKYHSSLPIIAEVNSELPSPNVIVPNRQLKCTNIERESPS